LSWRALVEPQGSRRFDLRWAWVSCVVAMALPQLIKRFTLTSCPSDLQGFGGTAAYVPHWLIGVVDGGAGHCFPSAHAAAAFGFLPLWTIWRHRDPVGTEWWLHALLIVGWVLGASQMVRGAHFMSHALWTACVCAAVAALADHLRWVQIGRRIKKPLL
jgi:membrane-associated PAP2 superfamily phosphatase